MAELRDLYQEVILDHSKKPRNFRVLEGHPHKAEGFNALCGDRFLLRRAYSARPDRLRADRA